MNCEDVRPLLSALVYDEVDKVTAEAIHQHLETCTSCRRRQIAFGAVRADLQQWEPAAAPTGITFIGMPAVSRHGASTSRWLRGLAVAASFVLGLVLTAAVVNLQLRLDDTGWSASTSLWRPITVPAEPAAAAASRPGTSPPVLTAPAEGTPVSLVSLEQMDQQQLEAWLDSELASRGVTRADTRREDHLSEQQKRQVATMLADLFSQEGEEQRRIVSDLIASSEGRQREELIGTLTSLMSNLEAQRQDSLLTLANQFGLAQASAGQLIERNNARIDFLLTQVGARTPQDER
ncbi:MAG: anti-sigma factor family protein [Acidobacteriota bacterium]